MPSYRDGKPTGLTTLRLVEPDLMALGSRQITSAYVRRSLNTVIRYCVPKACDVGTRANLYDVEECMRQFKVMSENRCSVIEGDSAPCGSTVVKNAPVSVCALHAATIADFWAKQDKVEVVRQRLLRETQEQPFAGPFAEPRASVVYYVQLGTHIKIGTTQNLQHRMAGYPPMARLLVTEPGGYTLEAKRLKQFGEYLDGGKEWFVAGKKLREHIEKLMAASAAA